MGSASDDANNPLETDQLLSDAKPLRSGTRLVVVTGPDKGRELRVVTGTYTIGKLETCDLPLTDSAVSRQHLEVAVLPDGLRIKDLQSTNGSFFQGAQFESIVVGVGAGIKVGASELVIVGPSDAQAPEVWEQDRFGPLLGPSLAMRQVFALLAKYAKSDAPVLVHGETGTGKELVAEAIHLFSARSKGPFVISDLASVSPTLFESELFGHMRGAFTGADRDRVGLFAESRDGTIFLDEIGELDLADQPRLLRALDRRQYRPVGSNDYRPIHSRVIAATNRDLRAEVAAGRFREDLYHRLSILRIDLPPLRVRRDDIRCYAQHFVERTAAHLKIPPPEIPPHVISALAAHDWPGNVRELRNVLERAVTLTPAGDALDMRTLGLRPADEPSAATAPIDTSVPFRNAKSRLIEAWEGDYVRHLLKKSQGNVSLAARNAGMSRMYLYQLIEKHRVPHREG